MVSRVSQLRWTMLYPNYLPVCKDVQNLDIVNIYLTVMSLLSFDKSESGGGCVLAKRPRLNFHIVYV